MDYKSYRGNSPQRKKRRWPAVLLILFIAGVLAFGALELAIWQGARGRAAQAGSGPEVMVIFGCQVRKDGPSILLRDRLDTALAYLEDHPDTQFKIWFPPYSILYWDKAQREGTTEAILTALEYAWGRLLAYDNVCVYSFLNDRWTTTNLEYYTDHVHCSSQVTRQTAQGMINGDWRIWPEHYKSQLDELRQFVTSYDYGALYSWQDQLEQGA